MSDTSAPEILLQIFRGSDQGHYRTVMTGQVNARGKHEARCLWQPKPVDLAAMAAHWAGEPDKGVAQIPINSNSQVCWGAIDVDEYRNLDLKKFAQHCASLPVVVCRSKSGGPHIFMFVADWVPAQAMMEKLRSLAAFLGHADSEVFPKQANIGPGDRGSGINLPYYGGPMQLRYALDTEGNGILSAPVFQEFVKARTLTVDQFHALNFEPEPSRVPLPDGPPCLNRLLASKPTENRNIILSNVAAYWKKADPEKWMEKLERTNRDWFPEPLPATEVEAIKKSYTKKEYFYQCRTQPLASVCDAIACRKCRHGVGYQETVILPRTMTKVNTSPPTWILTLMGRDGNMRRMEVSTEDLQNQRSFQRRCMDVLNEMPRIMKQDDWESIVRALIEKAEVVDMGKENTPTGQFIELVKDFLRNRSTSESQEDLLRGLAYKDANGYMFRPRDLWRFVDNNRFTALKQNQMLAILREDLRADRDFAKIAGQGVRFIKVPLSVLESDDDQPLKPADFPSSF